MRSRFENDIVAPVIYVPISRYTYGKLALLFACGVTLDGLYVDDLVSGVSELESWVEDEVII